MATCASIRAPACTGALAVLLAAATTAAAAPALAPPPVIFFWSSASQTDVELRPALVAALEAAAAATGARVLDLSPAASSAPDTAARVTRAITAYDEMRFAEAISELDAAASAAAESGAWGLSRDALVDLFLYRALSKTEARDEAGAWNDFVRAATLDPARLLDPARFRPTAVKSFQRAVHEVTARPPVVLSIRAPAGSRIQIDGRSTGRDEVREPLLPGEHYVRVERPAAPPFARTATLAAPLDLVIPDEAAAPPTEAALRARAARLGAGSALVVVVSHQQGIAMVELRSLERQGGVLRGAVRLGPSPLAHAGDLHAAVTRALRELRAAGVDGALLAPASPAPAERRWYQNRWLWLAAGAAGTFLALSPFVFDSPDSAPAIEAILPTDGL